MEFDSSTAKLVNLVVILAQLVSSSVALLAKLVFTLFETFIVIKRSSSKKKKLISDPACHSYITNI